MKNISLTALAMLICFIALGQSNMVSYQYWFDTATASRITVPIIPAPIMSLNNAPLNVSSLTAGNHLLYLRTQDAQGHWSSIVYRSINVPDANATYKLTSIRYWTDVSSSYPSDMRVLTFPNPKLAVDTTLIIDFCQSTVGNKKIYYQMQDNNGKWSSVEYRASNIVAIGAPSPFSITISNDTLFAPTYWGLQWYNLNGTPVTGATPSFLHPLVSDSSYYAVISNQCGAVSSDTLTYHNPNTGIAEREGGVSLEIYPNPSNGKFNLTLSERPQSPSILVVSNIVGDIIQTALLSSKSSEIELNAPAGLYFLSLNMGKYKSSRKIVIQ
ncbi:MAG: T9SS type A sorting domain-containing protein [Bacteroidetes bacterium]|nr:T9SS type A sorting domain-containing protein [Bacteroidota bacterium]